MKGETNVSVSPDQVYGHAPWDATPTKKAKSTFMKTQGPDVPGGGAEPPMAAPERDTVVPPPGLPPPVHQFV